jgi:hypothetical protein
MTPVLQAKPGPGGDCFAACLATILDLPLADAPDFRGDGWGRRLNDWLAPRGLAAAFYQGDGRPLSAQARRPPGPAILHHRLRDGSVHAAVCAGGRVIHDPSPRPYCTAAAAVLLWTVIGRKP